MAASKFKYQINHYLSIQPRYVSVDGIRKLLEARYGISQATFNRDRFLYTDDPEEIPQERIDIYATVLHVSADQLTQVHEPETAYGVVYTNLLQ